MPNIKAIRKGRTAVFAEKVWATGQPQRYGWVEIGAPSHDKKVLPAEILEFAEIRKGKRESLREIAVAPPPMEERPTVGEIIKEAADVVKEIPDVIREGKEFKKKPTIKEAADVAKEVADVVKEAKEVKALVKKRKELKPAKGEKKVIRKTRKNDNSK
jgi:hypothetical protein